MRPLPLWRHEVQRAGWTALLTPPLAVAAPLLIAFVDAGASASDREIAQNFFGALEMGVPLAAGIGAASLVGRDPAAELLLTTPEGYRAVLLRRLAVTVGWAALMAVLLAGTMVATGWWARWPANHGPLVGQLIWLAPTLGLATLGFLAGAAFRGPAAAGGLVAICWLVQQIFAETVQEQGWSRLLYLFATTRGTVPADWTANRITLIAAAAVFAAVAWPLLGRTERLLPEVTE
ncbi:hypothetical protein [Micromonospora sp. CPCC 206061]|uniref:hypothetical protein n=1 Tax=Micromonospora sp. CPCC 206061 TaxID=3122410 RepID=UPI002FF1D850